MLKKWQVEAVVLGRRTIGRQVVATSSRYADENKQRSRDRKPVSTWNSNNDTDQDPFNTLARMVWCCIPIAGGPLPRRHHHRHDVVV